MACIHKFAKDYTFPCATVSGGFSEAMLGKYSEALFINADDIDSFSAADSSKVTITMKHGRRAYSVQGVGNGITVTVAKIGGTTYLSMVDPSISVVMPSKLFSFQSGSSSVTFNSEVVIALKGTNGYTVFGLGAPLVCKEVEGDSTASEFVTLTFGVDEGQIGSTFYGLTKTAYDALKTPAA